MEVSIVVERDTNNTYPKDIKIRVFDGSVHITIDGIERSV